MTPQPAALKVNQPLNTRTVPQLALAQPGPSCVTDGEPSAGSEWAMETSGANQAFGMPAERQARLAARRAFVAMKLSFLYVVDRLKDRPELQKHVREAEEPHELWTLRASVFAVLTGEDPHHRSQRQLLNRSLETVFPMEMHRLN